MSALYTYKTYSCLFFITVLIVVAAGDGAAAATRICCLGLLFLVSGLPISAQKSCRTTRPTTTTTEKAD